MSRRIMNLKQIYDSVWDLLSEGAEKAKSEFHLGYLSTLNGSHPRVRTVVLRRSLIKEKALIIHTDKRSRKIAEIEGNPYVSMLFYSKKDKIQIRAEGNARLYNEGELFEKQWENSMPLSRRCYLIDPGPGTLTNEPTGGIPAELKNRAPTEEESEHGKKNFCIIKIDLRYIEWLNLHSDGHLRANFELKEDGFTANWLIP